MRKSFFSLIPFLLVGLLAADAFAQSASDQDIKTVGLSGDLGLAVFSQSAIIQGNNSTTQVRPYAYFDYDRFFARIDTFGIKTIPLGAGSLELVGKYNPEGYIAGGTPYNLMNPRSLPTPLGLGTFQLTPVGAFFFHTYQDVSTSKGKMAEFTYAGEIDLRNAIKIYPLIGFDYKDKQYLNYFYGVSLSESQRSGVNTYTPESGTSPFAAMIIEVPVGEHWVVNTLVKQKWLATSISNSPLVNERRVENLFISLNYRFE